MTDDNMETEMNTVVAVDFRAADEERGHDVLPLDLVEAYLRRFVAYPSEHALVAHTSYGLPTPISSSVSTPRRGLPLCRRRRWRQDAGARGHGAVRAVSYPLLQCIGRSSGPLISKGHEDGKIPTILYDEIDGVFGTQQQQDGAWPT